MNDLFSFDEVAQVLKITRAEVAQLVLEGKLEAEEPEQVHPDEVFRYIQSTVEQAAQEPERILLETHLAEVERLTEMLLQERRRRHALEHQLRQYQLALTEQAESLCEAHAMRKAAELKMSTPAPRKSWKQKLGRWLGLKTA